MCVQDLKKTDQLIKTERTVELIGRYPDAPDNFILEYELYFNVIGAIAKGDCDDPLAIAKAAARSMNIEFNRPFSCDRAF